LTRPGQDEIIPAMPTIALILKEIAHRKVNFTLACLGAVTAVALFIGFFTAGRVSERETARLMLSMGYNMHIIAKEADPNIFLLTGLADQTIPEDYVQRLNRADRKTMSYNHLLPGLQRRLSWRGLEVILTGVGEEVWPPNTKKPPMTFKIEPGDVYLGYRIWSSLGLERGRTVEIEGQKFSLADAQKILKMPGRISEIKAVDCLCFAETKDPVAILRSQIGSLLPEAQIFQTKAIAQARDTALYRHCLRGVDRRPGNNERSRPPAGDWRHAGFGIWFI